VRDNNRNPAASDGRTLTLDASRTIIDKLSSSSALPFCDDSNLGGMCAHS
jgi:hypothetical protein